MEKRHVDYSNTIIYKICCKDKSITDLYVGHTTNFEARKRIHKNVCKNLKNNTKIYKTIRENGGWNNWDMLEIEKCSFNSFKEAKMREQYYYEELNATLNSVPPYIDHAKYFCSLCNVQCNGLQKLNLHMDCTLHIKSNDIFNNADNLKPPNVFSCEKCKFVCVKGNEDRSTQGILPE